jgi:hypothetical protein
MDKLSGSCGSEESEKRLPAVLLPGLMILPPVLGLHPLEERAFDTSTFGTSKTPSSTPPAITSLYRPLMISFNITDSSPKLGTRPACSIRSR